MTFPRSDSQLCLDCDGILIMLATAPGREPVMLKRSMNDFSAMMMV
jgi:hypothetical protein